MSGLINFGLLDTSAPERVGNAYFEGQQRQQQNALMQTQLQGAQRQNKLAELAMADDEATREAYRIGQGDYDKTQTELSQRGQYKAAMEIRKAKLEADGKQATIGKDKATANKSEYELTAKKQEDAVRRIFLFQNADEVRANLTADMQRGEVTPEHAKAIIGTLPANPAEFADWQSKLTRKVLAPKEQVEAAQRDATLAETKENNKRVDARTVRGQNISAENAAASRDLATQRFNATQDRTGSGKPMPAAALKLQQEELDGIGIAASLNADLAAVTKQVTDGKLKLGLVGNAIGAAQNYVGASSENSRNLASFKATLEKLRNESLRLNKGVQTEGDSVRAWNEILSNINDSELVKQRLDEVQKINDRAVNLRKMNVDNIRRNYGQTDLDTSGYETQPAAIGNQGGAAYSDAAKEARYQAWKASQGK